MGRAVIVAMLAGCGRLAFEPTPAVDGAVDTAVDEPCVPGPWSAPRHQLALASVDEDWEPALSPDGLVVVYGSRRQGPEKLYAATRPSRGTDFSNARAVDELSGGAAVQEFGPAWSEDGTRLYFYQEPGGPRVAVHAGGGTFGSVQDAAMPGVSWAFSDDENELFYATIADSYDVHHARREGVAGAWTPEPTLDAYNRQDGNEGWPTFDDARDQLYIEQVVDGEVLIRVATRTGDTFGELVTVTELGDDAGDPDISPDGLELALSSRMAPALGGNDIFLVTRTCR